MLDIYPVVTQKLHLACIISFVHISNNHDFLVLHSPKFAWIVVKKNINTKFFLNQRGSLVNPPPGTVVDTEVTRKEW